MISHKKTLHALVFLSFWPGAGSPGAAGDGFLPVKSVETQPLATATERLIEALDYVGAPIAPAERKTLESGLKERDPDKLAAIVQEVFDPYCVAGVKIGPDRRMTVIEGPAKKELVQQGWRTFLVKVHNISGLSPAFKVESPHLAPSFIRSSKEPMPPSVLTLADVQARWLDAIMFQTSPMKRSLSGLDLEYCVLQLYSRDSGRLEATLGFSEGEPTGFRNAIPIVFRCLPAVDVLLRVVDSDGKPTTAALVIRDKLGRIYPNPARRLAPDFFFQKQIYRSDGEFLQLPPGEYTVEVSRGPEYLVENQKLSVADNVASQVAEFKLRRWIHAAERGWFSGDHHIHAAGCAHYENPTEGVAPGDMIRHVLGEDLNVGAILSYGPCWYSQKRYFDAKTSAHSRPRHLMRYDVEVSGFPSSHAGHLCLLGLTEDDYPGASRIEQWPSWTQPVLEWARKQGAVAGYAHSGLGLQLPDFMPDGSRQYASGWGTIGWEGRAAESLPDYALPRFDGVGANEYVVTATTGLCDFVSVGDTPATWELNVWYHTLNCGMSTRISGETDFPCIYGERVGIGRAYVKLRSGEELTYENWLGALRDGRSYCGDGRSHLFDFRVDAVEVGQPGDEGASHLNLAEPRTVAIHCEAAAFLSGKPTPEDDAIRKSRLDQKPYWHIERARQAATRDVIVEVIVNGKPLSTKRIVADGSVQKLQFDVPLRHSSWIAARIFPSCHTNPVFVEIGGKPIRASRKSAEWCSKAVDVCWESKKDRIRASEQEAAKAAYDEARVTYTEIGKQAVEE
jgi:hypothetical protein